MNLHAIERMAQSYRSSSALEEIGRAAILDMLRKFSLPILPEEHARPDAEFADAEEYTDWIRSHAVAEAEFSDDQLAAMYQSVHDAFASLAVLVDTVEQQFGSITAEVQA